VRKLAVILGLGVVCALAWPAASSATIALVRDGDVQITAVPGGLAASLGDVADANVDPLDVHVTRPDFGTVVHARENASVIVPAVGCSYAVLLREVTCSGGPDPSFGTGVIGGIHDDRVVTGPFPTRVQGPGILSPTVGVLTGAGNDTITSEGASSINAGAGDDVIESDNSAPNLIYCGAGHDRVNADGSDQLPFLDCEIVE
jgi:hypothetical protein